MVARIFKVKTLTFIKTITGFIEVVTPKLYEEWVTSQLDVTTMGALDSSTPLSSESTRLMTSVNENPGYSVKNMSDELVRLVFASDPPDHRHSANVGTTMLASNPRPAHANEPHII
ncbi:hypothetical protein L914_03128 [Phytophthora nicotianae]|nr:hypothetical protein L914_03128 [Phytophthora nicotianae]